MASIQNGSFSRRSNPCCSTFRDIGCGSFSSTARQMRAIEAAFAEMWRLYAAGEPPRAFAVETA